LNSSETGTFASMSGKRDISAVIMIKPRILGILVRCQSEAYKMYIWLFSTKVRWPKHKADNLHLQPRSKNASTDTSTPPCQLIPPLRHVNWYLHYTMSTDTSTTPCQLIPPLHHVNWYLHSAMSTDTSTTPCQLIPPLRHVNWYLHSAMSTDTSTPPCQLIPPLRHVSLWRDLRFITCGQAAL
jgi:hypothetical protein